MDKEFLPLLNDKEETILHFMKRISELEYENTNLKDEIKRLQWSLMEQD
jgi:hypothetical protein